MKVLKDGSIYAVGSRYHDMMYNSLIIAQHQKTMLIEELTLEDAIGFFSNSATMTTGINAASRPHDIFVTKHNMINKVQ